MGGLSVEGALLLRRITELNRNAEPVTTVADARRRAQSDAALKPHPSPVARVMEESLAGDAGEVGLRVYVPDAEPPMPAALFIHGGGWILGSVEHSDIECRDLCRASASVIVSVDYRLAPEAPFPGGLRDCQAALQWAAENVSRFGGDPDQLTVAGDSSGANLAAAVALAARNQGGPPILLQVLIYPPTDHLCKTASYRDFANGFGLTAAEMSWYWSLYLDDPADGDDPLASMLREPDLAGLPPTLLVTAECDVLRDEGEAYGHRLSKAGVPVKTRRYDGLAPIMQQGERPGLSRGAFAAA